MTNVPNDHETPAVQRDAAPQLPPAPKRTRGLPGWLKRLNIVLAVLLAFGIGLWIGLPGEDEHAVHAAGAEGAGDTIWTCSMHPQIQLPEPGQCPICGMDLIPLEQGKGEKLAPNQVRLSQRAKRLSEVRTARVRRSDAVGELRLLGRLEYDETQVNTITPWTAGRIDRLYVSVVGAKIRRGQAIAQLYSPEVYSAHSDLIQAKQQRDQLKEALPIARKSANAALESARRRLKLLGIDRDTLVKMDRADEPWKHITITSPYSGTVTEQLVNEGAYVNAGTPMFRTAGLGKLWVQLDAYESDLARIQLGQKVSLQVSTFPGEAFEGKVTFIDPIVDPKTRTAQVRVEVPNDKGRLAPGMFAEAVIHTDDTKEVARPLVIPDTAPLFTGKRSVVYVQVTGKDEPTYEAREVQLAPRAGGVYPVVSGLEEGEEVVVQGAFALDADLQIRGGKSMMTHEDDLARQERRPVRVTHRFLMGLSNIANAYLDLQEALADDKLDAAKKHFGELAKRAMAFDPRSPEEARKLWVRIRNEINAAALEGTKAKSLDAARKPFEKVSLRMIEVFQRFGNPMEGAVRLAFCPMAFDNKGAFWLQRQEELANPYFGHKMHSCGEIRAAVVEHGEHLKPAGSDKAAPAKPAGGHQH